MCGFDEERIMSPPPAVVVVAAEPSGECSDGTDAALTDRSEAPKPTPAPVSMLRRCETGACTEATAAAAETASSCCGVGERGECPVRR